MLRNKLYSLQQGFATADSLEKSKTVVPAKYDENGSIDKKHLNKQKRSKVKQTTVKQLRYIIKVLLKFLMNKCIDMVNTELQYKNICK